MNADRVTIRVLLPPDAQLFDTSPSYNSRQGQMLIFDFTLESDTVLVVPFRMRQTA